MGQWRRLWQFRSVEEYAEFCKPSLARYLVLFARSLSVAAVPDQDLTQGHVPPLEGSSIRKEYS